MDDAENLDKDDNVGRTKFCLRFNVPNVKKSCEILDEFGIAYDFYEMDWGTLAKFKDPDGNLIGIRSSKEHEEDMESALKK